ncbi:MAG TPA: phosphoribosylaminoimidazolesuccinocarboxamide synthase [Candidatus Kryptonia bacterium]
METVLSYTAYKDLKLFRRGKVRDVYEVKDHLLLVATDRISAFDVVLPTGIPHKGKVLNQISNFWFDHTKNIIGNHVVATDVNHYPHECKPYAHELAGRSMIVKKTNPLPIECIVRGFLSGSGWNDYRQTKSICGISLPRGLQESEKLPEPIFTPSTKAEMGVHDENITFENAAKLIGAEMAEKVRRYSIEVYNSAAAYAESKGIIIADTKLEFGIDEKGELILIDELLTPDSSRFWDRSKYEVGKAQASFDKQFVRDYLLALKWNKKPPAPNLTEEIIRGTSERYLLALKILTGIVLN